MAEPTVGEIMDRDPATVSPRTDVSTLIKLLREHELHGVPVVEEDGTLHLEDKLRKAFATNVEEIMTADVDTLTPQATVHEGARLISRTGHNRIPIVEGTKLVGVVTRVDALDALTRAGE
jgi:CBS-domain-containing membrane protein